MTTIQKVIKYLAMAFAVFLSVNIIGGIIMGIMGISFIFSGTESEPVGEMREYTIDGDVSTLSIELSGAELRICVSDKFSVESNHNYISVKSKDGKLSISETKKLFAHVPKGVTVILNVPEGFVFNEVSIETGAGKVKIDALSANILDLSLGAGKVEIENLTANTLAGIEGGAGELTIDGGKLCNLKLNMGVGELTLTSRIEGNSKIDFGIGEAELNLLGCRDDYRLKIDKGIGEAKLEGESMSDGSVYGTGKNLIDIDGGIGSINIKFSEH